MLSCMECISTKGKKKVLVSILRRGGSIVDELKVALHHPQRLESRCRFVARHLDEFCSQSSRSGQSGRNSTVLHHHDHNIQDDAHDVRCLATCSTPLLAMRHSPFMQYRRLKTQLPSMGFPTCRNHTTMHLQLLLRNNSSIFRSVS
jgi:hypothetical protein